MPPAAAAIPPWALRKALRQARRRFSKVENILTIGIGFKHRRTHGYGPQHLPCVKFVVRRKRQRPPASDRIPKFLVVAQRGRRVRVRTDVERIGELALHAPIPRCRLLQHEAPRGTPGFFATDAGGRLYLVTAGHVLTPAAGQPAPSGAAVCLEGEGGPISVGTVAAAIACPFDEPPGSGAVLDIGLVEITGGAPSLPAECAQPPWNQRLRLVRLEELVEAVEKGAPVWYYCYGANGKKLAQLDMVDDGYDAIRQRAFCPFGTSLFAPVLVHSRSTIGEFGEGDSGAPLVGLENALIGIHVLGIKGGGDHSWAVLAETALQSLGTRLGTTLSLL